jgi:hypothetical protein
MWLFFMLSGQWFAADNMSKEIDQKPSTGTECMGYRYMVDVVVL